MARHDSTWLAIRQPAVIRFLERELASPDSDALAVGLELAWRALGGSRPLIDVRLDDVTLIAGIAAVRAGRIHRSSLLSLRDQIDAIPIALSHVECDAVMTAIAAIMWAALDGFVREADDSLVA